MADSAGFDSPVLIEMRDEVNRHLERFLSADEPWPDRLREAMRYSVLSGGKRLRPLLAIVACTTCGGQAAESMPVACAVEMIHCYSLIHDDLPAMDDDDLRRGRPTNHRKFDEATAILAGDALLTLAFETIAHNVRPAAVAAACCADLAGAAGPAGMVGGQMADIQAESSGSQDQSVQALEWIHRNKTGRLLCASLTLGGRVAGAEEKLLKHLRTYGECVGLVFQIVDDLLDIRGDKAKIGKAVRKDTEQGKLTYPQLLGEEESQRRAEQLTTQACDALAVFGSGADQLNQLARYVLTRDR